MRRPSRSHCIAAPEVVGIVLCVVGMVMAKGMGAKGKLGVILGVVGIIVGVIGFLIMGTNIILNMFLGAAGSLSNLFANM